MSTAIARQACSVGVAALLSLALLPGCAREESPAAELGQLRELDCAFFQGPPFDHSPSYQWRMLINDEGSAQLSEYEAGVLHERVAECDPATFEHFAEALSAAQFTRLNADYLPVPADRSPLTSWSIEATTSSGQWSVGIFTQTPPTGVVAVQEALLAFKQSAQWRDA